MKTAGLAGVCSVGAALGLLMFITGLGGSLIFNWFKNAKPPSRVSITPVRSTSSVAEGMRDVMFGDVPLSQWASSVEEGSALEPWASFRRAKLQLDAGDIQGGSAILQQVVATPGLESNQYIQAYNFLRALGVNVPTETPKDVLEVIVEVGGETGPDLIVAYADHRARYYHSNGGVVWERPNEAFDSPITDVLNAARSTLQKISPSASLKPPAPATGQARVNVLTPGGLHLLQAPLDVISKDDIGGPVISASFQLKQALIRAAGPRYGSERAVFLLER